MKVMVCRKRDKDKYHHYTPPTGFYNLKLIEEIDRKVFNKGFFGNFVPHYCRYKNEVYLVHGSIDHSYMHGYDNDAYIVIE